MTRKSSASTVTVSVGDVPWADMRKFDDMIPKREFNNFLLRFEVRQEFFFSDLKSGNTSSGSQYCKILCVILEEDNIVASGLNRTNETGNRGHKTCRDEAIDELIGQWQKDRLSPSQVAEKFSKCVLYVTCEPCIMCASTLSFLVKKLKEEKCRGIMADAAVSLFNSVL
ncbi:hypothetical protein YC2023_066955 [Brassica napus]